MHVETLLGKINAGGVKDIMQLFKFPEKVLLPVLFTLQK